jgi:hypothetical protein
MIENINLYRLICDQCGTISDWQSVSTLPKGWRFREYIQSNGYSFCALTCSKQCRKDWENDTWIRTNEKRDIEDFKPANYGVYYRQPEKVTNAVNV